MEPHTETNSLPLSIAQVDSTAYVKEEAVAGACEGDGAVDLSVAHGHLLAAVMTRASEVEAAESALDQATAARDVHVGAALAAGISVDKVAAAAGLDAAALTRYTGNRNRNQTNPS